MRSLDHTVSHEWSRPAMSAVSAVLNASPGNLAAVTDHAKDLRGRVHGTVRVLTATGVRKEEFRNRRTLIFFRSR